MWDPQIERYYNDMENEIKDKIEFLKVKIENLRSRLPAHSIPAAMMVELDELEEELELLVTQLASTEFQVKDDLRD